MEQPVYSNHSRRRMVQREITEHDVEFILSHYHTEYPDKDGNRVLIGDRDQGQLKIVVAKDSYPPFIITTAWKDEV